MQATLETLNPETLDIDATALREVKKQVQKRIRQTKEKGEVIYFDDALKIVTEFFQKNLPILREYGISHPSMTIDAIEKKTGVRIGRMHLNGATKLEFTVDLKVHPERPRPETDTDWQPLPF